MNGGRVGGLWEALAWMAFPAIPVVLESTYHGTLTFRIGGFPDPHDWDWTTWLIELGPLIGFGFLAGLTLALPDEPIDRRGPRAWLSRRWFWVAVGPWAGFLLGAASFWGVTWAWSVVEPLFPDRAPAPTSSPAPAPASTWGQTWVSTVLTWLVFLSLLTTLCYGWLVFAIAAIRRARRLGRAWKSICTGLEVAAAFVGSLFGSFWAVTEWWRSYFFDPRIMPVVMAAMSVVSVSGCAATVTYGEVRRRELFRAMLLAWTIGLALLWRWCARTRTKPPRPPRT